VTRLIRSGIKKKLKAKVFRNFNNTILREEHKTILINLGMSETALYNQSDLLFFLSSASDLKVFCRSCGMAIATEKKVPLCFILLLPSPTIPEDDLPIMAKSWQLTYRVLTNSGKPTSQNWPGPGKSSSVIWWRGKVNLLNLKKGFDEFICLKVIFQG
jgi:hypothetical protein